MKKEMEEAVKNFKASKEYSDMLMVEYANGFKLLQKSIVKHHLDLNFSSLDMEEIDKEMLTVEAEAYNRVIEDAMVDVAKNVTPVIDNINLE